MRDAIISLLRRTAIAGPRGVLQRLALFSLCWALILVNAYGFGTRGQQAWRVAELLALAGWVIWLARRGQGLPRTPVDVPLLACLLVACAATFVAPNRQLAGEGLLAWLTLAALFYLLADLLLRGWSTDALIDALLLVGALVLLRGLAELWVWYTRWWTLRVPGYPLAPHMLRINAPFYPNYLAAFVGLLLPLALARAWQASGLRLLAWGLWLLAAALVLWGTSSRSGWLGSAVCALFMAGGLLAEEARSAGSFGAALRARRRPLVLFVLIGLLFLALAVSHLGALGQNRGGITRLSGRELFWQQAWSLWERRPALGWGLNSYTWTYVHEQPYAHAFVSPHAHSLYMSLLAETGLAGALAFGALLALGIWAVARSWRGARPAQRRWLLALAAAWSGFLVYQGFDLPAYKIVLTALLVTVACLGASGLLRPGPVHLHIAPAALTLALLALLGAVQLPLLADRVALGRVRAASWGGDWRQALEALEAAERRDPSIAAHYPELAAYVRGQAAAHGASELLPAAQAAYTRALRAEPGNAALRIDAAYLLGARAPQTRLALLEEAARLDPYWPLAHLLLAHTQEQDDPAAAGASYRRALALAPAYGDTLACRSSPLCRELPVEASAVPLTGADVAALQGSTDPQPWLALAAALLEQDRVAGARYALEAAALLALDQQPGLRDRYRLLRAALYERLGRPQQALAVLQEESGALCCYPSSTGPLVGSFGLTRLPEVERLLQTSARERVLAEQGRLRQSAQNGGRR
jgi:O-antigen ligase